VERLFGTITTELLPTLPGHIPPGNHGRPVTPPALTLAELDAAVGRYIVNTLQVRGVRGAARRSRANPAITAVTVFDRKSLPVVDRGK